MNNRSQNNGSGLPASWGRNSQTDTKYHPVTFSPRTPPENSTKTNAAMTQWLNSQSYNVTLRLRILTSGLPASWVSTKALLVAVWVWTLPKMVVRPIISMSGEFQAQAKAIESSTPGSVSTISFLTLMFPALMVSTASDYDSLLLQYKDMDNSGSVYDWNLKIMAFLVQKKEHSGCSSDTCSDPTL